MKPTKQPQHSAHVAEYYFKLACEFPEAGAYWIRLGGVASGLRFFYSGLVYAKKAIKEFLKSGGAA